MKILYHHRTRAEDAQGIHISEMVKAFRDLGHEVEIVALVGSAAGSAKKTRASGLNRLTRLAPNWFYEMMGLAYNAYGFVQLARAIRRTRPDMMYERYSMNTFCGIWVSRWYGIPMVLEVNAPLYYEQDQLGKLSFRRLARFSERWICSHTTWTVVVSQVMKQHLLEEGVPAAKMVVMQNGIDAVKFHPGICGKGVRQRYRLADQTVIGFIGWFRKWHGLEMLLEIMYESGLGQKGIRLLLVGDGPAYADLYDYAQTHDLLPAVIFTGPIQREDIPSYIAAMDITIQPRAPAYACPMKIFEYLGMGKCIVAPNQPNIREIINDGVTGYLFRPEDKESLRRTLLHVLDHPQQRESIGKRAAQSIHDRRFLWQSNAQRTLDLIFEKASTVPLPVGEAEMQNVA
jgi:glycosyltransferase involved in cell wall biosynthesis